jgi:hypothetical protein
MSADRIISPIDSTVQVSIPTNAYLIDAGEQYCEVESMGELGAIYEDEPIICIVFAATRNAAKRMFINFHKSPRSYTRFWFEWTDSMSIRLLARGVEIPSGIMQEPDPTIFDHCEEKLTRFGREFWLANSEPAASQQSEVDGE